MGTIHGDDEALRGIYFSGALCCCAQPENLRNLAGRYESGLVFRIGIFACIHGVCETRLVNIGKECDTALWTVKWAKVNDIEMSIFKICSKFEKKSQ